METALSSCSCGVVESASAGDDIHSLSFPLPPSPPLPSPPLPPLPPSFPFPHLPPLPPLPPSLLPFSPSLPPFILLTSIKFSFAVTRHSPYSLPHPAKLCLGLLPPFSFILSPPAAWQALNRTWNEAGHDKSLTDDAWKATSWAAFDRLTRVDPEATYNLMRRCVSRPSPYI